MKTGKGIKAPSSQVLSLASWAICNLCPAATTDGDGFDAGTNNSLPSGSGSVVAGDGNIIDGASFGSGVIGWDGLVQGSEAVLLVGDSNMATSEFASFLAGSDNWISHSLGKTGANNILLGTANSIDGALSGAPNLIEDTVLIGSGNQAFDSHVWIIGRGNIGQSGTVTVGEYAAASAAAAFIVGNGASAINRSNALVVGKDGSVTLPSGNLMLGSEPALGEAAALALMENSGYVKRAIGIGASATNGALLAVGADATAAMSGSIVIGNGSEVNADGGIAIGQDSVVTSGGLQAIAFSGGIAGAPYSYAVGGGQTWSTFSMATLTGVTLGDGAIALGGWDPAVNNFPGNVAEGVSSMSFGGISNRSIGLSSISGGFFTKASSAYSLALGSLNRGGGTSATEWLDTDPLFELGNGIAPRSATEPDPSNRSNAITTLKNGQTTLENKYWSESAPLESSPATANVDSGGEALVVKGHTRLKGRVIIEEPQGDILLGIFGE